MAEWTPPEVKKSESSWMPPEALPKITKSSEYVVPEGFVEPLSAPTALGGEPISAKEVGKAIGLSAQEMFPQMGKAVYQANIPLAIASRLTGVTKPFEKEERRIEKEKQKIPAGERALGETLFGVGTALAPVRGFKGKPTAEPMPTAATTEPGVIARLTPGATTRAQARIGEIGTATDPAALGSAMEQTLNKAFSTAASARSQKYTELMEKATKEAAGKESQIVDDINRYVKEQLLGPKSRDLNQVEKDLLSQSAAQLRGDKSLIAIEKEIRRLNDIAEMPKLAPGYSSIASNKAKEMAKVLKQSVDKVTKSAAKAREEYKIASEPINVYDYMVGKKMLEGAKDPISLPKSFFKSPYSVEKLRAIVGDEKVVEQFARNHIANEIAEQGAKDARKWFDSNKVWLKEFPDLQKQTETYVKRLEAIEKTKKRTVTAGAGLAALGGLSAGYSKLKSLFGGL